MRLAGVELNDVREIPGGDVCRAMRATTAGRAVFAKTRSSAPAGFFTGEAAGLDRLRVVGGPPIPSVVAAGADGLVLDWVEPGRPSRVGASVFGRALATLHRDGAGELFGADADGFIGRLPLDNTPATSWPQFYAERRLAPYLRHAVDRGGLSPAERHVVEQVIERLSDIAGPAEAPSRLHGDLWAGNLLWAADGAVWLIDAAAAHDGHRETDLAMLALFGAPYFDEIVAAYNDSWPLTAGWEHRVPLHQLHPLLIHAAHFGGGYGARAAAAAVAMLG